MDSNARDKLEANNAVGSRFAQFISQGSIYRAGGGYFGSED